MQRNDALGASLGHARIWFAAIVGEGSCPASSDDACWLGFTLCELALGHEPGPVRADDSAAADPPASAGAHHVRATPEPLADARSLARLANHIATAGAATRSPSLLDLAALDYGLVVALRGGDLPAVAELLRAAAAAGAAARPMVAHAAAALVAEQRQDGGFGPGGRDDPRPALTLACAWALAEVRSPGVTAQRTPE